MKISGKRVDKFDIFIVVIVSDDVVTKNYYEQN